MRYKFQLLKPEDIGLVDKIAESVNLDEKIDYNCDFIIAKNEHPEPTGLIGFNLKKKYPQFEHIIVCKEYQKSRLGVLLIKEMEEYLKFKGYGLYVAFILNSRNYMQVYAQKYGMKIYNSNERGIWFYKDI